MQHNSASNFAAHTSYPHPLPHQLSDRNNTTTPYRAPSTPSHLVLQARGGIARVPVSLSHLSDGTVGFS
jgi:hypothetical protein